MGHRDLLVTRTYRPIYKPSSIGHAKRLPQGFVQVGLCSFMVPGPRGEQPSFPSTDWGQFPSTGSQISIKTPLGPRRHFIAFPGLASAPPLHDLIESFEIRTCLPIREVGRRSRGTGSKEDMSTLLSKAVRWRDVRYTAKWVETWPLADPGEISKHNAVLACDPQAVAAPFIQLSTWYAEASWAPSPGLFGESSVSPGGPARNVRIAEARPRHWRSDRQAPTMLRGR